MGNWSRKIEENGVNKNFYYFEKLYVGKLKKRELKNGIIEKFQKIKIDQLKNFKCRSKNRKNKKLEVGKSKNWKAEKLPKDNWRNEELKIQRLKFINWKIENFRTGKTEET